MKIKFQISNGAIIQYGRAIGTFTNAKTQVTFPIAFNVLHSTIMQHIMGTSGGVLASPNLTQITDTGFQFNISQRGTNGAVVWDQCCHLRWITVGY